MDPGVFEVDVLPSDRLSFASATESDETRLERYA